MCNVFCSSRLVLFKCITATVKYAAIKFIFEFIAYRYKDKKKQSTSCRDFDSYQRNIFVSKKVECWRQKIPENCFTTSSHWQQYSATFRYQYNIDSLCSRHTFSLAILYINFLMQMFRNSYSLQIKMTENVTSSWHH